MFSNFIDFKHFLIWKEVGGETLSVQLERVSGLHISPVHADSKTNLPLRASLLYCTRSGLYQESVCSRETSSINPVDKLGKKAYHID